MFGKKGSKDEGRHSMERKSSKDSMDRKGGSSGSGSSGSLVLVPGEPEDMSRKKSFSFFRKKSHERSSSIDSKGEDSTDYDSDDKRKSDTDDKKAKRLSGSIGKKFVKMKNSGEDRAYVNPLLETEGDSSPKPTFTNKEGAWEPPASWRVIANPEPSSNKKTLTLESIDEEGSKGRWVAPQSWASNEPTSPEIWNIRVTKRDTTFATITCSLETTAGELCLILGKKFFKKRDDSYQLYLRKNGMEWHLDPEDQPIIISKKFLEAMGYGEGDKLEQQGRKDHGYLFSFIYSDKAWNGERPSPNLGDGRNFNAAGLNLEALPVSAFKQSHVIEHLNLSRNPRIDLPLDFAETCTAITSLNMSDCEFAQFPRAIAVMERLQKLDLSRNSIEACPPALGKLTNLVDLDLKGNQLSVLPREMESLGASLVNLNLSNNNFEVFPFVIFSLAKLKSLDLSYCRLSSVPNQIQNLQRLTVLKLVGNSLTFLPDLSKTFIVELDVRDNRIQDLSPIESTQTLKKVLAENNSLSSHRVSVNHASSTHLTLSSNSLTRFEIIPVSTLLTNLTLSHNKLISFPEVMTALANLENLSLNDNHLTHLPNIKPLKKLKTLKIANNNISELPNEIGDLSKLELLDVHSNNLKALPSQIWKLGNLVVLNATANLLEKFPEVPDFSLVLGKNSRIPLSESLFELYLGDNNLGAIDIFPVLINLEELRVLNLSNNFFPEIPSSVSKLKSLIKLQISGNNLTSIPDEIGDMESLRQLYLDSNKLVTLPAELKKLTNLSVVDVSHNNLKHNLGNIQYEWNWAFNKGLKLLDISSNPKLQYKTEKEKDEDIFPLPKLEILSMNELSPTIPVTEKMEQQVKLRRYGTDESICDFGIADFLGQENTFSICDITMMDFQNQEGHSLYAMFDGKNGASLAKYLQHWFAYKFSLELRSDNADIKAAMRKTFLSVNKDMGLTHVGEPDGDLVGCTAAIAYIYSGSLVVANIGDTQIVSSNNGKANLLTKLHDVHDKEEVKRIREAGGFINQNGTINSSTVNYTKAFGHYNLMPAVNAAPHIEEIKIQKTDELLIIATSSFWEVVGHQTAVDIARTEIAHPSRAAHRLRNYALSCGADSALSVMVISYEKRSTQLTAPVKLRAQRREAGDAALARLEAEIEPPVGKLAIVFTDIKNSTLLWETNPIAMRAAIKVHNGIMRRCLRNIGGYEVKTEGDAFMVAFKNAEDALKWCLTIQLQLLEADWPQEILESPDGRETRGEDGSLLFKGLSVRTGIHLGQPVCEKDPVTGRMDYFGPPVNRAARVSGVADGGQIVLSEDAWGEISGKTKNFEAFDLVFYDMGIVNLKGLGGEHLRMVMAGKVAGRTTYYKNLPSLTGLKAGEIKASAVTKAPINKDVLVQLSSICVRIEAMSPGHANLPLAVPTNDASLEDHLKVLEILISRIENATSTLWFQRLGSYTERIQKLMSTGSGETPHFTRKEDPTALLSVLDYLLGKGGVPGMGR